MGVSPRPETTVSPQRTESKNGSRSPMPGSWDVPDDWEERVAEVDALLNIPG